MENQFKSANEKINEAVNILCFGHRKPDGDTLGCLSAMAEFLIFKKKNFSLFCVDEVPANYLYLSHLELIANKVNPGKFDLIITLDCSDVMQTGMARELSQRSSDLINIDHHEGNPKYGNINIIDARSSTSEIIHNFLNFTNFPINKKTATALLTGIVFDTNNFTNPAANQQSFLAASDLMRKGANLKSIVSHIYKNKNISALKLWGELLNNLKYNKQYDVTTAVITQDDISKYSLEESYIEGITNFISSTIQTKALLVLKEEKDGSIKGSLRTNYEDVDVSKIAKIFGGGGHPKSSGFKISAKLSRQADDWKII